MPIWYPSVIILLRVLFCTIYYYGVGEIWELYSNSDDKDVQEADSVPCFRKTETGRSQGDMHRVLGFGWLMSGKRRISRKLQNATVINGSLALAWGILTVQ